MSAPKESTPYQPAGKGANRRRTLILVAAAVVVVAIGLALHVAGVLPPD